MTRKSIPTAVKKEIDQRLEAFNSTDPKPERFFIAPDTGDVTSISIDTITVAWGPSVA